MENLNENTAGLALPVAPAPGSKALARLKALAARVTLRQLRNDAVHGYKGDELRRAALLCQQNGASSPERARAFLALFASYCRN